MRNLPNKIEPIEPNYHEDDAISLLERWYDEWSKDEDWWSGGNTWDLNVFNFEDDGHWTVNVYGLEQHSTSEHPSTDTSTELDLFELKL
jgi:hypothetical protein